MVIIYCYTGHLGRAIIESLAMHPSEVRKVLAGKFALKSVLLGGHIMSVFKRFHCSICFRTRGPKDL